MNGGPRSRFVRGSTWCFVVYLIVAFALVVVPTDSAIAEIGPGKNAGVNGDGVGFSFALAPGNQPAASYFNRLSGTLKYSRFNGSNWSTDSITTSAPLGETALSFLNGLPHVIYLDSNDNLIHAYQGTGGAWLSELVDSGSHSGTPALATCGAFLCVSYYNKSSGNLRFARGSTGSWAKQTVDSNGNVGEKSAIDVRPGGLSVIAYYDKSNVSLKVASEQSNGSWDIDTVRHVGHKFGDAPSVAVELNGTIHAAAIRPAGSAVQDLAVYYAKKTPSGNWETILLSDDYAGGSTGVSPNGDGTASVAHRYQRIGAHQGNERAVALQTSASSGFWQTEKVAGEIGSSGAAYDFRKLHFLENPWGEKVLSYAFQNPTVGGNPALEAFRLHAPLDTDGDGIPDAREGSYGTSASDADSDNDGFIDGVEILIFGTNPLFPDASMPDGDQDGDGVIDAYDTDDDNDGLSDTDELSFGTNPNQSDSDGDGVLDGQEISDGTNPLDTGSVLPLLGTTLCTEWNGFLDGMWNIYELVNVSTNSVNVQTTIYDINGNPVSDSFCQIAPGAQCDVLVHAMQGNIPNSYGKVCASHTGSNGDLDGRMVYYKVDPLTLGFQFAFAMPVSNGKKGPQYVPFNTFQPSFVGADAANLVANWIQLTNLSNSPASGALRYRGQQGELLAEFGVSLGAGARQDFAGHDVGLSRVGIVEWLPTDSNLEFQLRNVRYLYDNPYGVNSFDSAFQLSGLHGSGELLTVPLDTVGASSIIEITNVSGSAVNTTVNIYSEAGQSRGEFNIYLDAHTSFHFITDEVLGLNQTGVATIDSSGSSSVVAVVMQYDRAADGSINHMYGLGAREALGSVLRGSYNTFLAQASELILVNPTNSNQSVSVNMTRSDGSAVLSSHSVSVPAHGRTLVNLSSFEAADNYGVVSIVPDNPGTVAGWVVRKRAGEFAIPTPARR